MSFVGSGSFGDVYLVHDRIRGHEVALKLLHQRDTETQRILRKEFRALKDLDHVNLVEFYELHLEDHVGYFTMEYVDGAPIDEYVERGPPESRASRIRLVLRQLVDAVEAMHARGVLHRDLKPTNIVVTSAGRLVVLDAGLAKNLESQSHSDRYICGTAWYMSPEQGRGAYLTPASDWYSVGVIAHKLMTGVVPFEGDPLVVLQQKSLQVAPSIASRRPDLPRHDIEMVDRLLSLRPEDRPDADALRGWLDASLDGAPRKLEPPPHRDRFVGRQFELATLTTTLDEVASLGRVDALRIVADAGLGKSTLVRSWLAVQTTERPLQVITGRCFQRELTPYNGLDELFDALVDGLAQSLQTDLDASRQALVGFLAERVDVAELGNGNADTVVQVRPDPVERRRLVGLAAHEILTRRAGSRATVLWLDDVQWVSRETAAFVGELLDREWPHGLLFVHTSRLPVEGGSDRDTEALWVRGRRLNLGALDADAAETLFLLHGGSRTHAERVLQ
ncbi:MAG TPA: serine/threonine-protein kinase, partial [Myxococcota bacterium]|nr:serine/threonine-protein kinase [Myxococcota bacterium]